MQARPSSFKRHLVEAAFIGGAFVVTLAVALATTFSPKADARYANVVLRGELVQRVDLSEAKEFEVSTKHGHVHIRVKDGKIGILSSPCPSQYCVHQGEKSKAGESIVCAYEGLAITLLDEHAISEIDV